MKPPRKPPIVVSPADAKRIAEYAKKHPELGIVVSQPGDAPKLGDADKPFG